MTAHHSTFEGESGVIEPYDDGTLSSPASEKRHRENVSATNQPAPANDPVNPTPESKEALSPRSDSTQSIFPDEHNHASSTKNQGSNGGDGKEFEVHWDGPDDKMDPKNLPLMRKWLITLTLSLGSVCVTCTSSLYTMTYAQLRRDFGVSTLIATLGLSLFVFGLGLSPMILSPLSEFYGRRPIYIGAFVFFTIWLVPCAVAPNIQTMLVARFFDGLSGSAFLSVAGGTVGDIFSRKDLQAPMMVFTASPFIGPSMGPLIGGFINQNLHWRWSFYVLIIWSAFMLFAITLWVPETYNPVLLRNKAQEIRKTTNEQRYRAPIEIMDRSIRQTVLRSLYRPFMMLCLDFMTLNLCLLSAVLLGILYLFFGAFDLIFTNVYGFTLSQVGLSFIGLPVGMLIALATDPFWQWNYLRLVANNGGVSEPEYRLPPSIGGAVCTVAGLFWFAWTSQSSIHWIVPIAGSALFGGGTILVYSGVFTFLVEAFPLYAASSLAANSFARSSFAAAFPLFGIQMYKALGYQWASSLLAFMTLALSPFPYIFFVYGKRLRAKSRFSPAKQ